ncbi:MAG TPA: diaminopimelate decarboxylase [Verrucomicrobia bacterium]|nr:MAG: diaminopimelate decarboxylase [Lentisphaerae bacterium GWF2_57_35]HBA84027.1 diaminopimelate decarboxylase [Verrucomicrobiota bacterium]
MDAFKYVRGQMVAEGVSVAALAERYGTPLYVYSQGSLQEQYQALADAMKAFKPLICFSVKTNTNAAVIRTFAEMGAGVDVVSGGELFRARRAGVTADRMVFAGVGKTVEEIEYALREDILFFTVESEPELERIAECAKRLKKKARVAFRVNPDVDPRTHKYISTGKKENKFGLDPARAEKAYVRASKLPAVEIVGLHMHIGSQILSPEPFAEALERLTPLCLRMKEEYPSFRFIDIGGGLGIRYQDAHKPMDPKKFTSTVAPFLKKLDLAVVMEPGRFLVGNAGILVARVQYVKDGPSKKFVVTDVGMNDLIRPPLYQAHHDIEAVKAAKKTMLGDVVGPICESGDFMAADRELPEVQEGDLLVIRSAGAYGFSMSSNYNSRGRAAEVLVKGKQSALIRRRETWKDLVSPECAPSWR